MVLSDARRGTVSAAERLLDPTDKGLLLVEMSAWLKAAGKLDQAEGQLEELRSLVARWSVSNTNSADQRIARLRALTGLEEGDLFERVGKLEDALAKYEETESQFSKPDEPSCSLSLGAGRRLCSYWRALNRTQVKGANQPLSRGCATSR